MSQNNRMCHRRSTLGYTTPQVWARSIGSHSFSEAYRWIVLPWGGLLDYGLLLFISSDKTISDNFLACSPNVFVVEERLGERTNMLISSYEVQGQIQDVFKAAILEEVSPNIGARLWDSRQIFGEQPLVLRSVPATSVTGADRYRIVGTLSVHDDSTYDADPRAICPEDSTSLWALLNCNLGTETIVVVPRDADLSSVEALLRVTENYGSVSDLVQIPRILASVPWFYAIRRNTEDWPYTLFVARDSELVRFVAEPSRARATRLIACL